MANFLTPGKYVEKPNSRGSQVSATDHKEYSTTARFSAFSHFGPPEKLPSSTTSQSQKSESFCVSRARLTVAVSGRSAQDFRARAAATVDTPQQGPNSWISSGPFLKASKHELLPVFLVTQRTWILFSPIFKQIPKRAYCKEPFCAAFTGPYHPLYRWKLIPRLGNP